MIDRLGVVDSFVGLATAMASVERVEAVRLVGAAIALRVDLGAIPTPREEAEVAAALAAIGVAADPRLEEMAQGAGADFDEEAMVANAARLAAGVADEAPERARTQRRRWPARG